jgi:DNA-binding response OmpR family regulator
MIQICDTGANGPAARASSPGSAETGRSRERSRAFLLEDNDANVMLIEAYLDALDLPAPVVAGTMAQAWGHLPDLSAGAFDLVICDLMLPDGESFDFIAELVSRRVANIAIYSARGTGRDTVEPIGLNGVLRMDKPLGFRTFRRVSGLSAMV